MRWRAAGSEQPVRNKVIDTMTPCEPDSARSTGEPATAVRSHCHDPSGKNSLCAGKGAGSAGNRPPTEEKRERAQMWWPGRLRGWGQKGWKWGRSKQGDPPGSERCSWRERPKSRLAGVRASVIAKKRVTSVEPRDAGKWMRDGTERRNKTGASGSNASASRRYPRPVVVGGTERLDRTHVDAAHVR